MRMQPLSIDGSAFGVPEVFSCGAFLRVDLEEAPFMPDIDSDDEGGGQAQTEGAEEAGAQAAGAGAPDPDDDGPGELPPLQPEPSICPTEVGDGPRVVLVPCREEIVDVAAGQFDDMFDAVKRVADPFASVPGHRAAAARAGVGAGAHGGHPQTIPEDGDLMEPASEQLAYDDEGTRSGGDDDSDAGLDVPLFDPGTWGVGPQIDACRARVQKVRHRVCV
eukprot:365830-Chlamydomonas_euryale.AAC.4